MSAWRQCGGIPRRLFWLPMDDDEDIGGSGRATAKEQVSGSRWAWENMIRGAMNGRCDETLTKNANSKSY